MDFHQEINKQRTFSTSVNQEVSYWLLPLFMEIRQHDLQYCLSCCGFQGPQGPQYSQTSD